MIVRVGGKTVNMYLKVPDPSSNGQVLLICQFLEVQASVVSVTLMMLP